MHVNCRIGSLESANAVSDKRIIVNCRIGSLETLLPLLDGKFLVNCRIGSLEMKQCASVGRKCC